jgi:hypothetical protein
VPFRLQQDLSSEANVAGHGTSWRSWLSVAQEGLSAGRRGCGVARGGKQDVVGGGREPGGDGAGGEPGADERVQVADGDAVGAGPGRAGGCR